MVRLLFDGVALVLRLCGLRSHLLVPLALLWFLLILLSMAFSLLWFVRYTYRVLFRFREHFVRKVATGAPPPSSPPSSSPPSSRTSLQSDQTGSSTTLMKRRVKSNDRSLHEHGQQSQSPHQSNESKLVITWKTKARFLVKPFVTTVLSIALLAYFGMNSVPYALDMGFNAVLPSDRLPPVDIRSQEWSAAQELHQSLPFVADMHADTLMWSHRGSMLSDSRIGHVDVPRMIKGNVAMQIFSSVTLVPLPFKSENNNNYTDVIAPLGAVQLWPLRTLGSYLERALFYANQLAQYERESEGRLTFIKTRQDLEGFVKRRATDKSITSALFSVEGLQCLDGQLESVDRLVEAGMRMAGLTHFTDNLVGGSAHGTERYGLTSFGRDVVRLLLKKNVIIDLAHASPQLIDDVLQVWDEIKAEQSGQGLPPPPPPTVSHTGLQAVCNNVRNLQDRHVKAISERGGVIGITFFDIANCGDSLDHILDSIDTLVKMTGGTDTAALGSDFDGTVHTPIDCSQMSYLTYGLMKRGYNKKDIEKIMGENVLRILRQSLQ